MTNKGLPNQIFKWTPQVQKIWSTPNVYVSFKCIDNFFYLIGRNKENALCTVRGNWNLTQLKKPTSNSGIDTALESLSHYFRMEPVAILLSFFYSVSYTHLDVYKRQ